MGTLVGLLISWTIILLRLFIIFIGVALIQLISYQVFKINLYKKLESIFIERG